MGGKIKERLRAYLAGEIIGVMGNYLNNCAALMLLPSVASV